MAMDTRNKRSSAIGITLPWRTALPAPDSTVDSLDWQETTYLYCLPAVYVYKPVLYYWLFDIGDDTHYSTQDILHSGTQYYGRIIPDSFSGISVKWNIGSSYLMTPNEITFDIFNGDSAVDTTTLMDAEVTVTYTGTSYWVTSDIRKWRFYVKYVLESYGIIHVTCENYLSKFLDGDYPVTLHPKEIWPSDDTDIESLNDYCVPVIFGLAYIPLMSVYTDDDDRFYVLGKGTTATYTIEGIRSPRNWPTSSWWEKEMAVNEILRLYLGEATGGHFHLTMSEKGEEWVLHLGGATGGSYTLGNGSTSETIAYNDNDAAIQAHLETVYGAGKVTVTEGDNGEYDIAFPTAPAGNVEESDLEADFDNLTDTVRPYLTQTQTYCPGGTTGELSYETSEANATAIQTALEALCGEQVTVDYSGGVTPSSEWLVGAGEYRQWTVPAGVYTVEAECWGGGGCAASSNDPTAPGTIIETGSTGGAGGGAYSKRAISVIPGQKVSYYFASNKIYEGKGDDSWFYSNTSSGCLAKGGSSYLTGGLAAQGYGDTKYSGGSGVRGDVVQYIYRTEGSGFNQIIYYFTSYNGGGGGGGAGTSGNGNNASNTTGGSAKSNYGGAGGAGATLSDFWDYYCHNGSAGSDFGGGGGGCKNTYWEYYNTGSVGGYGGKGAIRVSYGGGGYYYINFTTNVGASGLTANFTSLTGTTETPALTEFQAFVAEYPYEFEQSDSSDDEYKLCQFIIDDRDADGTLDSNGLWLSGDEFLPPLVKYYRNDTYFLDNPTEILEYVLEDLGLSEDDLDTTSSWATTESILNTREVAFSGGFWKKNPTEKVIASILTQFDGYIYESDKVELHLFDSASTETFDTSKTISKSFRPVSRAKATNDGGRVAWHEAETPQDVLLGKAVVRLYNDQSSVSKPSKEVLECPLLTNSVSAQKAGMMYFSKKFLVSGTDTFSIPITKLSTKASIRPGVVVTLDDDMFGEEHDIVVTEVDFGREGKVTISGARMDYIEDWDEVYADAVEVRESTTEGWKIYTADGAINMINLPTDADYDDLNPGDIYLDTADSTLKMK